MTTTIIIHSTNSISGKVQRDITSQFLPTLLKLFSNHPLSNFYDLRVGQKIRRRRYALIVLQET